MAITMASNKENEERDVGDDQDKDGKGKDKDSDRAEGDKNEKDGMFSLAKSTTAMVADREFEQVRIDLLVQFYLPTATQRYGAKDFDYPLQKEAKDL